jgi:hypothetical protein
MSPWPPVSHQTVRLARGKHAHPAEGVCVLELAAMLAGEPFSDRPSSVCPVIAGVLGVYDHAVDDETRQGLFAYAAAIVGTRGPDALELARAERALAVAAEAAAQRQRRWRSWFGRSPAVPGETSLQPEALGAEVARSLLADGDRGRRTTLELVDQLIALGGLPEGRLPALLTVQGLSTTTGPPMPRARP